MWRAIFLAIGIALCILGLECMVVEKAVLADAGPSYGSSLAVNGLWPNMSAGPSIIETAEWMPWCFMTIGVVVIIYTVTLPRRLQG